MLRPIPSSRPVACALVLAGLLGAARAQDARRMRLVPDEYPTIAAALADSADGDEIRFRGLVQESVALPGGPAGGVRLTAEPGAVLDGGNDPAIVFVGVGTCSAAGFSVRSTVTAIRADEPETEAPEPPLGISIEDVVIDGAGGHGAAFSGVAIRLERVRVAGAAMDGFEFRGCPRFSLKNVRVADVSGDGVHAERSSGYVGDSDVRRCGGDGIDLEGAEVRVQNVSVALCAGDGVRLTGSAYAHGGSLRIDGAGGSGAVLELGPDGRGGGFQGIDINGCGGDGIVCAGPRIGVESSTVRSAGGDGIVVRGPVPLRASRLYGVQYCLVVGAAARGIVTRGGPFLVKRNRVNEVGAGAYDVGGARSRMRLNRVDGRLRRGSDRLPRGARPPSRN